MTVFVDTSALYAIFDRDDEAHPAVADAWRRLLEEGDHLVTSSYVVVETVALLQRRLGIAAVDGFDAAVLPTLEVVEVDRVLREEAMTALLAAGRRGVSLVDWVSFRLMRRRGLTRAFAVDTDFLDQGFVPA